MTDTVYRDILGKEVKVGQYVATYIHNSLRIYKVVKLTPKMVRVERNVTTYKRVDSVLRNSSDLVVLDTEEVVMHQLTK